MTNPESRLNIDQIKSHPVRLISLALYSPLSLSATHTSLASQFFYGVDWSTIRNIEAPFVPHLRSITDTSYFPTEDLEAVPDQQPDNQGAGSGKDLAFLGYSQSASHPSCRSSPLVLVLIVVSSSQLSADTRDTAERGLHTGRPSVAFPLSFASDASPSRCPSMYTSLFSFRHHAHHAPAPYTPQPVQSSSIRLSLFRSSRASYTITHLRLVLAGKKILLET